MGYGGGAARLNPELVDHGSEAKFSGDYEDIHAEARTNFGEVKLVYIEFWHNAGCGAQGVSNTTLFRALKGEGWTGETIPPKGSDGDLYMSKKGEGTKKFYTLHRAGSQETGFNLCAPAIFLPATAEDKCFEEGKAILSRMLTDLTSLRSTLPAIINSLAAKELKCQMEDGCKEPVVYIDAKGFVYCFEHGQQRKVGQRCRKLKLAELKKLHAGEEPLAQY